MPAVTEQDVMSALKSCYDPEIPVNIVDLGLIYTVRFEALPEDKQDDAWAEFFATHRHDVNRLILGRAPDGSVGLSLRDGSGKVRILLNVQSDGKPVLQFLDDSGKVVSELTGQKK